MQTFESQARDADLILAGGKVFSGVPNHPEDEAIAIAGGRVLRTGKLTDVGALAGPHTVHIPLNGRRVVPGLIDSHVHVVRAGLSWADEVRWGDVTSLSVALDLISQRLESVGPDGCVSVVGGWHPGQFAERRSPSPEELNQLSSDIPIYIQQQYDQAILNHAALTRCGIVASNSLVEGAIERDSRTGEPTGIIRGESAFAHCLRVLMNQSMAEQVSSTMAMQRDLNSVGLTGAIDLGGASRMTPEAYWPTYEIHRQEKMTLRTRLYVHPRNGTDELEQIKNFIAHLRPGFGDDMLRVSGIGEILFRGYYDGAGFNPVEIPADLVPEFREATRLLANAGWPVNVHAIHDATISAILDVWEEVDSEIPLSGLRFSISHADAISPTSLRRAKALGIGIMVQDRMGMRTIDSAKAWGVEAVLTAPPLASMAKLGIPFGGGTDATVAAPINPWRSLWWMITGGPIDGGFVRSETERLSREEALAAYTLGSAWFSFDDDRLGSLAPGKLADLAVLSDDYFEVEVNRIPDITSVLTLVGGKPVHCAEEMQYLGEQFST